LVGVIREHQGKILAEPFHLSDGTGLLRAEIPVGSIEVVSNDTVICRVSSTVFLTDVLECTVTDAQHDLELDPDTNLDELPIVVVLDDGVNFPDSLEPIVVEHWLPTGSKGGQCKHGTEVASKASFANVGEQIATGRMTPRARIIDCNIRDETRISEDTMIRRIKEAVETFHEAAKIYNFSSAAEAPIDGDIISNLGYELDYLSYKFEVKFTIAAGNHKLYRTETSLESILDDTDARIALPADSMLNISVGSVVGKDHNGSLSKRNDVAPYSRIGPGFCGMRKPDIVAYGGTILNTGKMPFDEYSLMIANNGKWAFESGTSFTAPVVAGDIAQILKTVPNENPLMAETLLYHGAELPLQIDGKNKLEKDEAAFYGDCYGRGLPVLDASMYSSAYRVTFIHSGTLNRKTKRHVKFLMPKVFESVKKQRKAKVIVTCVTQPPVDHTKGEEYLGAYVMASLHKLNGKGKNKSSNPKVTDGRKKWDTCYHFEETFSSFTAGDWEVWLELYSRWDVENTQEVEYALAVTVEDLTKSHDIYNEIVTEAKGRFPAVELVRIPVRR
jgi:subtilisin family serine protease